MALFRYFWKVILPIFLLIFSSEALAELNPEIRRQIVEFDPILTRHEQFIQRSDLPGREKLKELEQFAIKIRSQTNECIINNYYNTAKIDRGIGLLGNVTEREDRDVRQKQKSLGGMEKVLL